MCCLCSIQYGVLIHCWPAGCVRKKELMCAPCWFQGDARHHWNKCVWLMRCTYVGTIAILPPEYQWFGERVKVVSDRSALEWVKKKHLSYRIERDFLSRAKIEEFFRLCFDEGICPLDCHLFHSWEDILLGFRSLPLWQYSSPSRKMVPTWPLTRKSLSELPLLCFGFFLNNRRLRFHLAGS